MFGLSHAVAQLAVAPYVAALGFAAYAIARMALPRGSAVAVGLLAIGTPEAALWGRQVMLDVPAYAMLLCCILFFMRHLARNRTVDLALAGAFFVVAAYTKLTVIFILPALLTGFIAARGGTALLQRRVVATAVLTAAVLMPLIALAIRFGAVNAASVAGRPDDIPRWSLNAWLFYAQALPGQLGWPAAVVGVGGIVALIASPRLAPARWAAPLLIAWIGFGYAVFSFISVRAPRLDLMVLFPVVLGGGFAFHAVLPRAPAQAAALLLAGATFGYSLVFDPPPRLVGYQQVADYVAAHAPPNCVVLFSGYRDGSFVFNLRAHEERRDIITLRADKLLLRIAVERERGVRQTDLDEAEIAAMLRQNGVGMVVAQAGFWDDLREMNRLNRVLAAPLFKEVATFRLSGALSDNDGADRAGGPLVRVLRPTYPVEPPRGLVHIDIPFIHTWIEGSLAPK